MQVRKHVLRAQLIIASMLVGAALPSIVTAQKVSRTLALTGKTVRPGPPGTRPRAMPARSREPAGEIERLRTEMDALHSLLKEQTQAIGALQKRLDEMQAAVSSVARVSPVTEEATTGSGIAIVKKPIEEIDRVCDEALARKDACGPRKASNAQPVTASAQPATSSLQPVTAAVQPSTAAVQPSTASAQPATVAALPQAKKGLLAGWGDDHAFIRNETGSFETDFLGYSQLDFRGYSAGDHPPTHPPNTFIVRRARIAMEGKIDTYFEFRIEGDFADTNSTLLRDFYVNIHRIDQFVMRFGQTRQPFSQEEMRSDNFQEFVERSLVNNLAPSRSPGVMAYGKLGDGIFEYQTGAFNGKGLLALNNNGTPDTALRLRFNPWRRSDNFWIKGLIVGGAYSMGRNLNGQSIKGVTPSQITFFQPDTVNGRLYRANGEVTWLLGPAALRAEFDQSNQLRENLGPRGTNLPGVLAKGYMAQFTYLLTGETQPDIGYVVPNRPLFDRGADGRTGIGAWQLKVRYDNLQIIDGSPKSNRASTIYFGPNWYMNRWVRYLLDFGVEQFTHPANGLRPNQRFFTVLSQIQLQL
jgi:phosphate-selective porin OprO/OprP